MLNLASKFYYKIIRFEIIISVICPLNIYVEIYLKILLKDSVEMHVVIIKF